MSSDIKPVLRVTEDIWKRVMTRKLKDRSLTQAIIVQRALDALDKIEESGKE